MRQDFSAWEAEVPDQLMKKKFSLSGQIVLFSSSESLKYWDERCSAVQKPCRHGENVLKANKQLTLQLINQHQALQHSWENQVCVTQFSALGSLKYFKNESKNRGQARRWSMPFELQVVFPGKTKQAKTKSVIWVFFPCNASTIYLKITVIFQQEAYYIDFYLYLGLNNGFYLS